MIPAIDMESPPEILQCWHCGEPIMPGDDYYTWKDHPYCSEECIKDELYEDVEKDVTEEHFWTTEEIEDERADREYEEQRDDGIFL